jgi:hypothetical protein
MARERVRRSRPSLSWSIPSSKTAVSSPRSSTLREILRDRGCRSKGCRSRCWVGCSVEQQTFTQTADSSAIEVRCGFQRTDRREGHFAVPVLSLLSGATIKAPRFAFLAVRSVSFQERPLLLSWCTNPGCPDSHDRLHQGSSLENLDYDYNTADQFMGRYKPLCAIAAGLQPGELGLRLQHSRAVHGPLQAATCYST